MGAILIVDDDDMVRRAIVRKVKRLGHIPYEAANGVVAKNILRTNIKMDAIVSDVSMPVMDGITFYYWLESEYPELANRFAFLSASEDLVRQHPRLHNIPFYEKPTSDMDAILDRILSI